MSVFKTTTGVLERLSVKVGGSVMMLPVAEQRLQFICAVVDELISEFDAETYTVSVVPEDLKLEISVLVPEMIIEDCVDHGFFKLIESVDRIGFSVENDSISIDMSIDNLFYIAK